jgi:thioredoxin 1
MTKPIEVTDETFESDVLHAAKPILVDFWAEWCGPCKMIAPIVEEIAEEYKDNLHVAKLDVDSNRSIPQKYGIQGIPTLILFHNGDEKTRVVGFRTKQALAEELLPYIE